MSSTDPSAAKKPRVVKTRIGVPPELVERSSAGSREEAALAALRKLTSVPLTWHARGEAEQRSFDATMEAYRMALEVLRG